MAHNIFHWRGDELKGILNPEERIPTCGNHRNNIWKKKAGEWGNTNRAGPNKLFSRPEHEGGNPHTEDGRRKVTFPRGGEYISRGGGRKSHRSGEKDEAILPEEQNWSLVGRKVLRGEKGIKDQLKAEELCGVS